MSELWFTADLHLGHGNIIKYCQRPFLNEEEKSKAASDARSGWKVSRDTIVRHDNALIDAINERVAEDDTLWILGDFSLCSIEEAQVYRNRIVCRGVNLVWGNHDLPAYESLFNKTIQQGMIKHEGQKIWLNHYPMRSWDKSFHGSWHLYGHVHARLQEEDVKNSRVLTRDVGVDATDYAPVSFTEMARYMKPREKAFWAWKESMG